jgi:hypothetical protein
VVAPLWGVRLAEDHQIGREVALDDPGRRGGDVRAQRSRTHRLRRSGERRAKVFEKKRNPGEGSCIPVAQCPGSVERRRLLPSAIEEVGDDGVQIPGRLEPVDRRLEEFHRQQLARGGQFGLSDRVEA